LDGNLKKAKWSDIGDKKCRIHGALMQKENPEQISTQFATVESIDDYIDKAQQLGAKVIKIRMKYKRI
jgi:predicted enzyme related to lactoylglutathione lyase